jgi:hypothetical protein
MVLDFVKARVLPVLSHQAWTGIGSLFGILACLVTIFKPLPVAIAPGPHSVQSSDHTAELPTVTRSTPIDDSPRSETERHANEIMRESLNSIGPDYHGVHQYFNDFNLDAAGVLFLLCLAFIACGFGRRAATKP